MKVRATYRLQFSAAFGFDAAADLAPYLARLGVSHVYASSYLKARPGSTHGYDIVDHNALNPELGDEEAFGRMVAAFRTHGLGQILDFVPNHMGVGGSDNPFWLDILEWGADSDYAGWFDIEWAPERNDLAGKLLVPVLGHHYGTALESGLFALKFDAEAGSFAVWVYETHKLPVSPFAYGGILGAANATLERLGDAFAHLGEWRPQIVQRADALKAELAAAVRDDSVMAVALARATARFNGRAGEPETWAALDALIRDQHWRPAYFRVAADDINYRRFFDVAELAGIRMELPAVFDHAHRLAFDLLGNGTIDGLRIDHIDGLLDPKRYLERLRAEAPQAEGSEPFYLVVEKILGEGEALPRDWPVDGTTGYEVANLLLGLMIDPNGEAGLTALYREIAEDGRPFERILRDSKKRIMDNEMASELAGLARAAARVALQTNDTADFTRNILRRALREIVACFPVYRTYVDFIGAATEDDRRLVDEAIALARQRERAIDGSVYDFLGRLLTGDLVANGNSGFSRTDVLRCAMKLQQYSGPVMAKGLEDTAFYRYNRFIALNEVGGDPQRFGTSIPAFHAANPERADHWPRAMLATATHDTKRGEDARARLAVLSECPEDWAAQVRGFMSLTGRAATAPDRNDLYALLQTLVGTIPIELLSASSLADARAAYAERVKGTMTKAMREAKVRSTWAAPNEAYEAAMLALIDDLLTGETAGRFLPGFVPFAGRIARLGMQNSLVQTVLKLTVPGVPDIYQGAELWDLSMVDPDNRRPVDYAVRSRLLEKVERDLLRDKSTAMAGFYENWADGRVKLAAIRLLLRLRAEQSEVFAEDSYEPLAVEGLDADAICAFERRSGDRSMVVAVARFPGRRERTPLSNATYLRCRSRDGQARDLFTGDRFETGEIGVADLFATLPVAVLVGSA